MAHKRAGRKVSKAQRAGMPHYGPSGEAQATAPGGMMGGNKAMQKMMRQMSRRKK